MVSVFTMVFLLLIGIVVIFQLALALGAPWGSLAMGGRYPGKFPPAMRIAAVVQMMILLLFGAVILIRSGMLYPEWLEASKTLVWIVVTFNAVSSVLNIITPSKWERIIWAPVALLMLFSSIVVALG